MNLPRQVAPVMRSHSLATFTGGGVAASNGIACTLCKLACSKLSGIAQQLCLLACDKTVC
jgi:hypothetical protein